MVHHCELMGHFQKMSRKTSVPLGNKDVGLDQADEECSTALRHLIILRDCFLRLMSRLFLLSSYMRADSCSETQRPLLNTHNNHSQRNSCSHGVVQSEEQRETPMNDERLSVLTLTLYRSTGA